MKPSSLLRVTCLFIFVLVLFSGVVPTHTARVYAQPAIDFVAFPILEVTQGVQNMQPTNSSKSVPLVAGKRTYVIFYATSLFAKTTASLTIERNGKKTVINPLNKGLVDIGPIAPRRIQGGIGRFVFELPANQLNGTINLQATINPKKQYPTDEANIANNSSQQMVATFHAVPTVRLDMWDVRYKRVFGKRIYQLADLAPTDHRALMIDWLRRAYPFNNITWYKHSIYMGRWANTGGKLRGYCVATDWALYHNGSFPANTYGYGMVADTGGYMRGCADPVHNVTASGPTGNTSGGDGSYGDDYGGHELGHLFGRDHAAFCGAGIPKSSYPYPNGSISPVESDQVGNPSAVVGYDITSRKTYNYNWHDIMTYCNNRWPSDISYKRFFQHIAKTTAATRTQVADTAMDRIMIRGAIDLATGDTIIRPSFVLTDSLESPNHQPGPYAFVMRDTNGGEIDRYAFAPSAETTIDQELDVPQQPGDPGPTPIEPQAPVFFHELLPYHQETARIDLVGPDGALLGSVAAGTNAPTVTMLTANTTTRVPAEQEELPVQWEGSDPDGDQVYYLLQYSNDNGRTWLQYSDAITETEVVLPRENLMAGTDVKLRVLATDGIHTSADSNDAQLTVFNHPPTIAILPPQSELPELPGLQISAANETTFALSQTVTLVADGYDTELGSLDQAITWSSDIDGVLQQGHTLSTADLSVGQHIITATADDGAGGVATAQIPITVVATMEELPAVPDRLVIDTDIIQLHSLTATHTTLAVHNQNTARTVGWVASVDQPWLTITNGTGETPDLFTAEITSNTTLAVGTHTATVTFTSPEIPSQTEQVQVVLTIAPQGPINYLPLMRRE